MVDHEDRKYLTKKLQFKIIKSVKSKIFQIQRLKRTLKTLVDPKRRSLRTKSTNWSTIKYSINLEAIEWIWSSVQMATTIATCECEWVQRAPTRFGARIYFGIPNYYANQFILQLYIVLYIVHCKYVNMWICKYVNNYTYVNS